jgi:hypothetical protein
MAPGLLRASKRHAHKENMDYLEFIARVISHIPDKGQVMVRYYCLYSNPHRSGCQRAEITENREIFLACPKKNFL